MWRSFSWQKRLLKVPKSLWMNLCKLLCKDSLSLVSYGEVEDRTKFLECLLYSHSVKFLSFGFNRCRFLIVVPSLLLYVSFFPCFFWFFDSFFVGFSRVGWWGRCVSEGLSRFFAMSTFIFRDDCLLEEITPIFPRYGWVHRKVLPNWRFSSYVRFVIWLMIKLYLVAANSTLYN